jgi:hypothetical protein
LGVLVVPCSTGWGKQICTNLNFNVKGYKAKKNNNKKERIIMIEDRKGEKRRYKRGKKIDKNGHDPPMGEL